MRRKGFLIGALLLLFLPMGLIWFGYGEKGYYGYAMLGNLVFPGGWLGLFLSIFLRGRAGLLCKIIGGGLLCLSYGFGALQFCGHLPPGVNPLTVCRMPMWVSFAGLLGLLAYLYAEAKKSCV